MSASIEVSPSLLEKSSTALNTVQIRLKDADGNYLKSASTGRGNRWNSWEQITDSDGTVYSNFKTFTADYASLVQSDYDASDVKILQDYLHGRTVTIPDGKEYDLNGDGIWNIYDLIQLKKILIQK